MTSTKDVYNLSPQKILAKAATTILRKHGITINDKELEYLVTETPNPKYGDYGFPAMRYARLTQNPAKVVEEIGETLKNKYGDVIEEVIVSGRYLNIRLNAVNVSRILFDAVRSDNNAFGLVVAENPERIVVEHTSANPVHPLHIGHARNSALGDTLARLLKARGHRIQRRFYINDLGRQVAVLIYGLKMLGTNKPPKGTKPDHWYGYVYAVTHTLIDLVIVRNRLEELRKENRLDEYRELIREQDKLTLILAKLRQRDPSTFDKLADNIMSDENPEKSISDIMHAYEYRKDPTLEKFIRDTITYCLEGFKATLQELGVDFDKWDWESDLSWKSLVRAIIDKARNSKYATIYRGTLAIDFEKLLQDKPGLREELNIRDKVPPLILVRSDGTTLYTTRDIAYTLLKYDEHKADKVINVIASEQKLEQLQVKLALIALGYEKEGRNLIHYAYEMVNLPGRSMAGRRGEYVTLDELLEDAIKRAYEEVEKRNPGLDEETKTRIAKAVGAGAIRYSLLSTSAQKPIVFDMESALDFEKNTAPYIQYTYARAHNILAKYGKPIEWDKIDYSAANGQLRRGILLLAWQYPYVFAKAADELRPELLVAYVGRLADAFNKWYQKEPVIREPDEGKRAFKLALTYTVKTVIGSILEILGITPLERM